MIHSSAIVSCIMSLVSTILAPMPKFYDIVLARETKGYHSAPYVATVLNSMLGCYYFALKNENKLFLVTNIIGFEAALIYLTVFYLYSGEIHRIWVLRQTIFFNVMVPFCIVMSTYMLASRVLVVELLYAISSVFLYAAPFMNLLENWMQKHVQYKHFLLSSFVGARAVAALVYGLYTMDIYAIISHSMGCGFALGQIITYFYLVPTVDDKTKKPAGGEARNEAGGEAENEAGGETENEARARPRARARAEAAAAARDGGVEHDHEA